MLSECAEGLLLHIDPPHFIYTSLCLSRARRDQVGPSSLADLPRFTRGEIV